MNRREFIEFFSSIFLASFLKIPTGEGAGGKGWSLNRYFEEFLTSREYNFPYPEEFEFAERIMPFHRTDGNTSSWKGYLNLFTRSRVDVKIYISDDIGTLLHERPYSFSGVEGNLDLLFSLDNMGKMVFYQVFYNAGNGFKPFSPPKAFKNPKYAENPVIFMTADTHIFDDNYYLGKAVKSSSPITDNLEGSFFHYYLKKSFHRRINPRLEKDPNLRPQRLRNIFHLAQSFAFMIKHSELPDAIFKLGDDLGLQRYRYERQGLSNDDRKNAELLWKRERKIWSVITPLVPVYQVIGNHDGENGWEPWTRPHAIRWRKKVFKQPGEREGGSKDQDYYTVEFGNDVQFIVLNVVGYMRDEPVQPEKWTLGKVQFEWFKRVLSEGKYSKRFVLFHHVLGGMPRNASGMKRGGYGRGPLFTREDYEKYSNIVDPDKVEQVKITEIAVKHGVRGFFYGHDHIHFLKEYDDFFAMCVGTTNEVVEEALWQRDKNGWVREYGLPEDFRFFNSPVLEKISISKSKMDIKTVCSSVPDKTSNLFKLGARIGQILAQSQITFRKKGYQKR